MPHFIHSVVIYKTSQYIGDFGFALICTEIWRRLFSIYINRYFFVDFIVGNIFVNHSCFIVGVDVSACAGEYLVTKSVHDGHNCHQIVVNKV